MSSSRAKGLKTTTIDWWLFIIFFFTLLVFLNPTSHYCVHHSPATVCLLSYINPFHYSPFCLFKVHINIILPSTSGFSKWFFPSGLHTKTLYTSLVSPIPATWSAHLILLDLITRIIFGEQYRSLSSSLCSFYHFPVILSFLSPNILLITQFSNTIRVCSSLNMSDQDSHPYKTTDYIIILYILEFLYFWIATWKTKYSVPNDSKHSLTSICS